MRLVLNSVVIERVTANLESAINTHIVLTNILHTFLSTDISSTRDEDRIREAIEVGSREANIDVPAIRFKFRSSINFYLCKNHTISSPSATTVDEVLMWRARLLTARKE